MEKIQKQNLENQEKVTLGRKIKRGIIKTSLILLGLGAAGGGYKALKSIDEGLRIESENLSKRIGEAISVTAKGERMRKEASVLFSKSHEKYNEALKMYDVHNFKEAERIMNESHGIFDEAHKTSKEADSLVIRGIYLRAGLPLSQSLEEHIKNLSNQ